MGCYVGESARTGYDRGAEHEEALRTLNPESPLVEHSLEHHANQPPRFQMKVLTFIKTNIMRQATEAAKIQGLEGGNLLNRRGEWGHNLPPKLVLEDTPGEMFPATGHKRKKAKEMVPVESTEGDKVQHNQPECSDASRVPRTTIYTEDGSRPKKPRLEAKTKVDARPKLAPTRAASKSVKEMILIMRQKQIGKAQGSNQMFDGAENSAGLSNSDPAPDDESNTAPKFPR